MEKIVLEASVREDLGKSASKHLRKDGKIPGVIYKGGKVGVNIQVGNNALWHALHTEAGENAIITMDITGGEKPVQKTVIVKELQTHPLSEEFLHVDFHEISLKEKLQVKVPVVVKGEAVGVKEDEGLLGQLVWELEVECLPTEIPEHIDIHVDELRIGDTICIKDVTPPEGVTFLADPEQIMVTVNPPQAEEVPVEEEAVAEGEEEGEAEPEVIKKGKKEEEEAAEGEEAPPAAEE
ncbi:MAG: 50S ribosomal protein L25 [Candidatus Omnitrophota bacterium]